MVNERILAWHFLPEDGRLRWGDRETVEAGKTYAAKGRLVLCKNGMHASERAIDALQHAPGSIVCRVELSGQVLRDTDKLCARKRTVLWMADATMTLHTFACNEAELALERERKAGREPDERSWKAIKVKRQWMAGKATDKELAAACDAAWDAWVTARTAARAAAWAASRDAWFAARDAWFTARAAWVAARDAASYAAWSAANQRLKAMLAAMEAE